MPLKIENRGTRTAVIQLDPSVEKVRQVVRVSRRDKKTGKKNIISKKRVIGGSLTILPGHVVSKLPSGHPIPATVGRLDQVRKNRGLRVTEIDAAAWDKEHRRRPKPAPKSRRRTPASD